MKTLFEDAPAPLATCRLRHDPFWPPVHRAQVRQAMNLEETVSDLRLEVALQSAIIRLERDLAGARLLWRREGYTALDQVPASTDGAVSTVVHKYREALYDIIRVLLAEQLQVREYRHG
jgi:hypothetical protein